MPESPEPPANQGLPHLWAGLLALGLVTVGFSAGLPWLEARIPAKAKASLGDSMERRDQGLILQRAAVEDPKVFPIYGSSELTVERQYRATDFFRQAPTGFQVCPIGKAGNTCLMMAEKLAALGKELEGRKLAVVVSFTWFKRDGALADQVAGNFSALQASTMLLDHTVDEKLEKRLMRRMLDYPDSLDPEPLLAEYLSDLDSRDSWWSRQKLALLKPFMDCNRAVLHWEDRLATALTLYHWEAPERDAQSEPKAPIAWDALIAAQATADKYPGEDPKDHREPPDDTDAALDFIHRVDTAGEWKDLEMLLDTIQQLHAKALVLSVPLPGSFNNYHMVSRAARNHYYSRLEENCTKRGLAVMDFTDYDLDVGFIMGGSTHPTPKGWLYIDRVLDDFYHDRFPSAPTKA